MKKISIIILTCFLLACGDNNTDTNTLKTDNVPQAQHSVKDTSRTSDFDSLYYLHSKAFTLIDSSSDAATWKTFMNGIKTYSTDSINFLLQNGSYCCFDKHVTAYDYESYLKSDSGRIFSHRIICKKFDLTHKNELGFLIKFFKGLKLKYMPTSSGFEKVSDYWSGMIEKEEPLVCVHYKINLKNIKPQNFYLLYLQTSFSTGYGSDDWFCTFDKKGNLIDCVYGTFGTQSDNCIVEFDKNENIKGKYEHYYQTEKNGKFFDHINSFEYVIKITKEGKFSVIKTSKKRIEKEAA